MKAASESLWSKGWACLVSNHSKTVSQHCKQRRKSRKSQNSSFHHALQNLAISNKKTPIAKQAKFNQRSSLAGPLFLWFLNLLSSQAATPSNPWQSRNQSLSNEFWQKKLLWLRVRTCRNMTHVTMSDYIICNEHIMKTSSTCVFLVKSEGDNTQFSVFCHLFLLPTHHDAPAQIIMENLCSWLVSVGYTVFFVLIYMSTITIVTVNFRPLFPDMVAGSLQLQATRPQ